MGPIAGPKPPDTLFIQAEFANRENFERLKRASCPLADRIKARMVSNSSPKSRAAEALQRRAGKHL